MLSICLLLENELSLETSSCFLQCLVKINLFLCLNSLCALILFQKSSVRFLFYLSYFLVVCSAGGVGSSDRTSDKSNFAKGRKRVDQMTQILQDRRSN